MDSNGILSDIAMSEMEDLTLKCAMDHSVAEIKISRHYTSGCLFFLCREYNYDAIVNIDEGQARQLHEWLGRYLEKCDE